MRKAISATFFALLVFSPAGSVTAGPTDGLLKMDPSIRIRLSGGVVRDSAPVSIFVKTSDVNATRKEIERLGGQVGTVAGDILTVRLPNTAIAALATRVEVSRLEAAHKVTKRLEKVLAETKVDKVHAGAAGTPFKGAGVVVGVIDAGFDATHEAFRKSAGGPSRVVAFWDQQATTGAAPAGFTYGTECTTAQLTNNTCPHSSTDPHGTHVLGIAAGGPVQGAPFVGMAPEADIAYVNVGTAPGAGGSAGFTTAICDAASFIFKAASALGKPAVVNMSLGEHSGPHDGTSLADQCLDNLTGPGKILVAAAGNEGQGSVSPGPGNPDVFIHATGMAGATPSTVRFLPSVANNVVQGELVVWTDSPGDLSVRIGATNGMTTTFSAPVTRSQPLSPSTLTVGELTVGPVAAAGGELPGGARGIQIVVRDVNADGAELKSVTWVLEVTGSGKFDAFLDTTGSGGFIQSGLGAGVTADNRMSIGYPAIASKVIAVGSYVTQNAWTPLTGGPQKQTDGAGDQVTLGALSKFSSRGPARRSVVVGQKPEIVAPGEIVASALNSRAAVPPERTIKASPSGFYVAEGTSMASPAVAGLVALMLQKNPRLGVDDVKRILTSTATPVEGVTHPDTSWGAGKANALAAVMAVPAEAPGTSGTDGGSGSDASPRATLPPTGDPAASSDSGGCTVGVPAGGAGGAVATGLVWIFALAGRRRRPRRP